MSSSGLAILVFLIFGFVYGLWLAYKGTRKFLLLQRIENTATSKIASAALGLVELYGRVRSPKGMESPISGEKCAYWCIVGQYYRRGRTAYWAEIFRRCSTAPFPLEDGTGRMRIDPNGAQMAIPAKHVYNGSISGKNAWGDFTKLDRPVLDFIDSLDDKGKKAFMDRAGEELRVYEFYIAEGDPVYVLGDAMNAGGTPSEKGHENLIVRKKDMMYVSDSPERKIIEGLRSEIKWNISIGISVSIICAFVLAFFAMAVLGKFGY